MKRGLHPVIAHQGLVSVLRNTYALVVIAILNASLLNYSVHSQQFNSEKVFTPSSELRKRFTPIREEAKPKSLAPIRIGQLPSAPEKPIAQDPIARDQGQPQRRPVPNSNVLDGEQDRDQASASDLNVTRPTRSWFS